MTEPYYVNVYVRHGTTVAGMGDESREESERSAHISKVIATLNGDPAPTLNSRVRVTLK